MSKMTQHRDMYSEKSHKSRAKLQRRETEQKHDVQNTSCSPTEAFIWRKSENGAQGHENSNQLLCNGELEVTLCV